MLSDYVSGSCPACPSPFNMAAYVLSASETLPDKVALQIVGNAGAQNWTYKKLRQAVLGTATGLVESGVTSGDKLLMRLGNTIDFPIVYLAALAVGAVPVPTASSLTVREVSALIATLEPDWILIDPQFVCPDFGQRITVDDLRGFRHLPASKFDLGSPERLGYMVFTSGTSGHQRAVCHAHRAIWARQMMFNGWYGLQSSDRVMHAGAFNWTYTLGTGLMDPWTIGATAIIPEAGTPVQQLPELMRRYKATIFAAAPGIFRQILATDTDFQMPELRHGLSAGEKLPSSIADKWFNATGCPLLEAYGMSECSTFVSHSPDAPRSNNTLGRPQPGRRIAIVEDGAPVSLGSEGTIAIHRSDPGLMLGYYNEAVETNKRFAGDWFLTGDRGKMDADGYITFLGRSDDMMNAGGFRVSPIEVENVLLKLDGVDTVAVTEVTVKEGTNVIAAFYTGPSPLDETVWRSYVTETLARYKQPRMFIHQADLPMGSNGKILRRALRDRFES